MSDFEDAIKQILTQLVLDAIKEFGPKIIEALAGLIIKLFEGMSKKEQADFVVAMLDAAKKHKA